MSEQDAYTGAEYEDVPEPSEQLDQIQPDDSLLDRGVDDILDEGWTTPERWSVIERRNEHETLDERLAEEVPDFGVDEEEPDPERVVDDNEVGTRRAGRLVDPNQGNGADEDSELYGTDVGIDGAAASAEEAAVHIIDSADDR
jgi:hypothetical protein